MEVPDLDEIMNLVRLGGYIIKGYKKLKQWWQGRQNEVCKPVYKRVPAWPGGPTSRKTIAIHRQPGGEIEVLPVDP